MKEQTGSFDVALRNMIATLVQGQNSDNQRKQNDN